MAKADPESYPVSEEEMGRKYKTWTESLARYLTWMYSIGKEVGGEQFVDKVKDKFLEEGMKSAKGLMKITGTGPDDFNDCTNVYKIWDTIDESAANYWHSYVEKSPEAFEKEIFTCPGAKIYSKEPEICSVCIAAWCDGVVKALNPKFEMKFSKLMPEGDDVCRYRVKIKE